MDTMVEPPLFKLSGDDQTKFPSLKEAYIHFFGRIMRFTSKGKWKRRILIISNAALFIAEEAEKSILTKNNDDEPLYIKRPIPITAIGKLFLYQGKSILIQLARGGPEQRSHVGHDLRFYLCPVNDGEGEQATTLSPTTLLDIITLLYHNLTGRTLDYEEISWAEDEVRGKLDLKKPANFTPKNMVIPSIAAIDAQKRQAKQQQGTVMNQSAEWQERASELNNKNTHLKAENCKLFEEIEQLKAKTEAVAAELQATKTAKEELEQRTAQSGIEDEEALSAREKLQQHTVQLEAENHKLKDELLGLTNTLNQNEAKLLPGAEQLKSKNEHLQLEKLTLQEELAQVRDQLSRVATEKDELHARAADMNATVANQEEEELASCKAQIEDLQAKLNTVTQELMKTQSTLVNAKVETASDIDLLQTNLESTEQELQQAKMVMERASSEDVNVLRQAVEKKDEELEALRRHLETTRLTRGNMNTTGMTEESQAISNVSSHQNSSFIKDVEKPGKGSEVQTLKHQLEKKDKQLNQTKTVLREAFKRQVEELETIRQQFQQYDDQIVAYLERVFNTTSPPPHTYLYPQTEMQSPLVSPVPFYSGGSPSFGSPLPGGYSTSPPPPPPVEPSYYYGQQAAQQGSPTLGGGGIPPQASPMSPSPVRIRPTAGGSPTATPPHTFTSGGNYSYYQQQYGGGNSIMHPVHSHGPPAPGGVPMAHHHVAKPPHQSQQQHSLRSTNFSPTSSAWGLGLDKFSNSGSTYGNNGFTSVHPAAGIASSSFEMPYSSNAGQPPLPQHQQAPPVQASPIRPKGIFTSGGVPEDSYVEGETTF